MHADPVQVLLSVPPAMAPVFADLEHRPAPEWVATADPPGAFLGSGGATANLLIAGWRATGRGQTFEHWLGSGLKLLVHGGGQSRRLPGYAAVGKPLMPLPVLRWSRGQRLDQALLDIVLPEYRRVLAAADCGSRVMLTSGDVVVRPGRPLPPIPEADVVGLGVELPPEEAQHFGVFFLERGRPGVPAFFLQKPDPDRIRELLADHQALVDTGIWLLSARALEVLFRQTGWSSLADVTEPRTPRPYELYAGFGLALGTAPAVPDAEISGLSCALVTLPEAEFFHLGTSRQLIEAMSHLQNRTHPGGRRGSLAAWGHPDQHLQNSRFELPLRRQANHTLWVENCTVPATWTLACEHVLTNVPPNTWDLRLEPGVCLDFMPVGASAFAVRCYGLEDAFRGPVSDPATRWLGQGVTAWLAARGLTLDVAGLNPAEDLQRAPWFPVMEVEAIDPRYLEWLFARTPAVNPGFVRRWVDGPRISADEILRGANVRRLYAQREAHRAACLEPLVRNAARSVFYQLDLGATAPLLAAAGLDPGVGGASPAGTDAMRSIRERVVRAAVARCRGESDGALEEAAAFRQLRDLIEAGARLTPALPCRCVLEDQIVWGRSPVRLDLAGGWTDTPPYCLEHGGRVVNVAVDVNGQPPLQVFARLSDRPELVIRSIDLGAEQHLRTYEELDTFAQPGSEFALAKAALALAGFLPRFHAGGGYRSLAEQLGDFGGGIEISLLAAVPKGSGLGTSSILAATLLATLGDLCGLGWDRHLLSTRTLALEQMVTTGGGWQDQVGGVFRGIKRIETAAGFAQEPAMRWLPDHLFGEEYANRQILLYYTGLTRMAKGILHEVVRGVFLNSPEHLSTLTEIGANTERACAALQEVDYAGLGAAIRRSWALNQRLDAGTNPPEVRAIFEAVGDYLEAAKLLGAGGGGYLLMLAKDATAAGRIREVLRASPPNPRARFVTMQLSNTGLQLTRS